MLSTAFKLLPLALFVAGAAGSRPHMVHKGVARRAHGDIQVAKRATYTSARWSFYDVGLGACGETNVATDYIVALNSDQYGSGYPGPECFKQITMTYNGKTATATITDECPGCPYGGLDLSRGLFDYFASEDVGIVYGEWSYVDDSSSTTTKTATTTTKAAEAVVTTTTKAATTSTKKAATTTWTPATTSTKAATTSTPKTTAKTSSSSSSHKASSASAYTASFSAASSSAASLASSFSAIPSASASSTANSTNTTAQIQNNLETLNTLLTNLGALITSATLNTDDE